VLLAALALSACAQAAWQRPGGTQADSKADAAFCHYEAEKATAGNPSMGWAVANSIEIFNDCMKLKGWSR
jgi:hypothetical protein